MNFLALCQALVDKAHISGAITTTVGQTGEMGRVVNWVNDAWRDLQLKRTSWDWMRYEFTLTTEAGKREYQVSECIDDETGLAIVKFSKWHKDTLRVYRTSAGKSTELPLSEIDYRSFRDLYQLGQEQSGQPNEFAVKPRGKSLLLGPKPDDIFTVYGEYQRSATLLSGDGDVPGLPEEFHMLIVQMAREKYAFFENAPEVLADAQEAVSDLMAGLLENQTEEVTLGDPLA